MSLDYMYSLAYVDYDKLCADFKERTGLTLTNVRGSKLDRVCQLLRNLHYYNADGTPNPEGDTSRMSRWLFVHTEFFDKVSESRLWLCYFNWQKTKKTWTYCGICTADDLVSLCGKVNQDVSVTTDLLNIVEDIKLINKSLGDSNAFYTDMAKARVKNTSAKLKKQTVAELDETAKSLNNSIVDKSDEVVKAVAKTSSSDKSSKKSSAVKAETKAVTSEPENKTSKITEKTDEEVVAEFKSSMEQTKAKAEESTSTKKENEGVSSEEVESVSEDGVERVGICSSRILSHADIIKSLDFVEIEGTPVNFVEELSGYVDKSCIFTNTRALAVYFKALTNRLSGLFSKYDIKEVLNMGYCLFGYKSGLKPTYILFNSGLPSIFGDDIYIVADFSSTAIRASRLSNYTILTSKSVLKEMNFEYQGDISLKKVPFYSSPKDLIFDADVSEFDFEDKSRLAHCLEERNYRLPDEIKAMSFAHCCRDIKTAVIDAIKLNSLDYTYIKPIYNYSFGDSGAISFALPYWINQDKSKKPSLAIILFKMDGFWKIATVLPMRNAYASVVLLSPYTRDWDEYL